MNLDKNIGTLIKLINISNMAEIWGMLEDYDGSNITLSKAVIIVNRGVADMAQTMNDIIQYKWNGEDIGSTISSPLSPIFNNVNDKSVVTFNTHGFIITPIYENTIDDNLSSDDTDDGDLKMKLDLKESMLAYVDAIFEQYAEMTHFMLDELNENETKENETKEEEFQNED